MKKKYPKVTVLLTLRNSVETIRSCIDSLLKLKYPNYEIFVVDAFSSDGSYEILKSYGKKIILYQVKGWAPVAYNWALQRIKSEYIS
ncbi:MAG: glycosyltransferase family 2 protein, partial [Spirochaetota bacterium]|nr:glycosyltransferase family 2 protein [Spirochaetota bacterium]